MIVYNRQVQFFQQNVMSLVEKLFRNGQVERDNSLRPAYVANGDGIPGHPASHYDLLAGKWLPLYMGGDFPVGTILTRNHREPALGGSGISCLEEITSVDNGKIVITPVEDPSKIIEQARLGEATIYPVVAMNTIAYLDNDPLSPKAVIGLDNLLSTISLDGY